MLIFSTFRYAFEGIIVANYGSNRQLITSPTGKCPSQSPQTILEQLDMPTVSFSTMNMALCAWIVALHISIYSVLRMKLNNVTNR